MENSALPSAACDYTAQELVCFLAGQRRRIEEFLAIQQQRVRRVEQEVAVRLEEARREAAPPARRAELPLNAENYEEAKQRILDRLESEFTDASDQATAERLKIEEVLRITEQSLQAKDRELDEMRHLLSTQSEQIGGMAVGAAALGGVLDNDALIREHRDHLQHLQEELEEKLRQAEVELSQERASLARERAALEAEFRSCRALAAGHTEDLDSASGDIAHRSRWLERLGLKEADRG